MRNLTLLIPGLFGPRGAFTSEYIPQLDSLEKLMGRARCQALRENNYYRQAASLMQLESDPLQDLPVAAVTRLIDEHEPPQGVWLRADPVHLAPDRDRLLLIEPFAFELNQHDALAVAAEVGLVLQHHGWRLEAPHTRRWYIRFDKRPDLLTTDIKTVAGQDINQYLPTGSDARKFHQVMNEVQMQLHESDINRERAARNEVPVNSIWFWGLGGIPAILDRAWSTVYCNDDFINGLAMLSATPCRQVARDISMVLDNHPENALLLVVLDHCHTCSQYQDLENWYQNLLNLDDDWFSGILDAMQEGVLDEVTLITGNMEFNVNKMALRKFWRRPKTLEHFMHPR